MTNGRRRGSGIGGDQEILSPFVTDKPEAETIARRGQDGYLRTQNLQISRGLIQIFQHILQFPEAFPDDDTFLAHTATGFLAWLPAGAISGAIDWVQIINKPSTIGGYGIQDAYTKTQIQSIIDAIDFADTGFGNPIAGVAARSQLPVQIAYEDEVNVFSDLNTFNAEVTMNDLLVVAAKMRRGIRSIDVNDSPYTWAVGDWHLNVNPDLGAVEVLLPTAASYYDSARTDQIHVKHSGKSTTKKVTVTPPTGEVVDGHDSAILREPNLCFTLVSDGSDWWIQ